MACGLIHESPARRGLRGPGKASSMAPTRPGKGPDTGKAAKGSRRTPGRRRGPAASLAGGLALAGAFSGGFPAVALALLGLDVDEQKSLVHVIGCPPGAVANP